MVFISYKRSKVIHALVASSRYHSDRMYYVHFTNTQKQILGLLK